jgi:hypothetical protein
MELIPILAFIILVATIITFIFATGAYMLFKIRERKGNVESKPQQPNFKAEVVTPKLLEINHDDPHGPSYEEQLEINDTDPKQNVKNQTQYFPETGGEKQYENTRFFRYTSKGQVPFEKQKKKK